MVFVFYYFLRNPILATFCLAFFLLGAVNFHYALYSTPERISTPVLGKVRTNPETTEKYTKIEIETEKGRAILYTEKYTNFRYGDVLSVSGNFRVPEDKSYRNYLKKDKIYYTSFYPEIEKVGEDRSLFFSALNFLRYKMKANIQKSLPAPQSFLAEAMILGDRSSFSDDFNKRLSISGTRHITAISGMHIVIISSIVFLFFSLLKIDKKRSALLSLLFIVLFIIFVGAPASAVRAGIMGSLVLLTHVVYRKTQSLRIIFFAGAAMLAANPLLLHYDLGFQLSFLAVAGILIFHSPIKNRINKIIKRNKKQSINSKKESLKEKILFIVLKNENVVDLAVVSISAQILVTPLILYNFGHISMLSIPANLIIVPLLQYIIPFIFLTAATGFFLFSLISYFLLSVVVMTINIFSSLPFSAIYIESVSIYLIVGFYLYIFYRFRHLIYI